MKATGDLWVAEEFPTEDLIFYHGTSAAAGLAIIKEGTRSSVFDENGAKNLAREILSALLDCAKLSPGEESRLHFAFNGPGSEYSTLWVSALRDQDKADGRTAFGYGHFYVTLNIGNAYRYAIGNPYRSEFLLAIAMSLKVLEHEGHPLPHEIETRYPEVHKAITIASPPAVLEVRGISRDRLLTENGDTNIDAHLRLYHMDGLTSRVNMPLAFRVLSVSAAEIIAIHDLSDWPKEELQDSMWQPKPERVAEVRLSVREWRRHASRNPHDGK